MAEAFLYCWTDNKTNMLYIGVHKGSPNDGYVCSSKYMMEEYNIRPNNFSRQIIAEGTWDDIFKLEGKILLALNVKEDDSFYNMHNGSGDFRNKFVTREARKKLVNLKKENQDQIKVKNLEHAGIKVKQIYIRKRQLKN